MDNTPTTRGSRSLVISLAVVLTIIDLTLGFTLHNPRYPDLFADESTQLEVQHEVKRSNDFETTENAENRAVLPLRAEENRTIAVNASVIIAYPKDATESYINDSSTEATEPLRVTNDSSTVLNVNPINLVQVTTSSAVTKTSKSENQTETRAVNSTITNILNNDNKTFNSTSINMKNNDNRTVEKSVPFENMTTALDSVSFENVTTTLKSDSFKILTATLGPLKTMNATSPLLITEDITTVIATTERYTSISAFTTNGEPMSSKQTETEPPQIDHSVILNPTKAVTVNSTTAKNYITRLPWKQYSDITRIRTANVTDFGTTSAVRVADSINSHSTESRVTLQKKYLAPNIPSWQELKNNLKDSTKVAKGIVIETTIMTESPTNPMASSTNEQSINENATSPFTAMPGNQIEMVSKRAGYLNHTKPMTETQLTSVAESESEASAYEFDLLDHDRVEKKTSKSQMADDAIMEELLKESITRDEVVNTLMHNTLISPKQLESVDDVTLARTNVSLLTDWEQKVKDELSVKPITQEKKNSILYTVNPNYKPLKKLEIQPPKPFTRDPDDNSWRNESLTSLGIVFNAKNSSKAFTEVLKNKTETVMNNLPDQNRTTEKIELRERLEKIAEKRKSKKNKTDSFGNIEYSDYEENNSSNDSHSSKEALMDIIPLTPIVLETTTKMASTTSLVTNPFTKLFASTLRAKSRFLVPEYYETAEDEDYPTIPKIDIKKTKTATTTTTSTTTTTTTTRTPSVVKMPGTQDMLDVAVSQKSFPERKPTVQYFPPRPRPSTVNNNGYSDKLGNKINIYTINAPPRPPQINIATQNTERTIEESYPTKDDFRNDNVNTDPKGSRNPPPIVEEVEFPVDNVYLTQPPNLVSQNPHSYDNQDNVKGGFIIKHYKDFIDKAIKDSDYDRTAYLYTASPFTGVTANDEKPTVKSGEYADYEQRKELLDRFVTNFNQNHERFKVDFPVLFNTSIVHKQGLDSGKVLASSSAMFKRLYNDPTASKANGFLFSDKAYDPNCENITVELSPAYELHYYVPDQEEREEQRKVTLPHMY